jgi:hypothetical protein
VVRLKSKRCSNKEQEGTGLARVRIMCESGMAYLLAGCYSERLHYKI